MEDVEEQACHDQTHSSSNSPQKVNMSFTNRLTSTRLLTKALLLLMAGVLLILDASQRSREENIRVAAMMPFAVLFSFSLALAVRPFLRSYSRHARGFHDWSYNYVHYGSWYVQTYPAYWLAYGLWAARYTIWWLRQALRKQ